MEIAITIEEIMQDSWFSDEEEARQCFDWLRAVLILHPEDNTYEKLLDWVQKYKEMTFQNS